MDVPTTSEFIRSATSDAISSACFALIEQMDSELRDRVLSENKDIANTVLENMINKAAAEEVTE